MAITEFKIIKRRLPIIIIITLSWFSFCFALPYSGKMSHEKDFKNVLEGLQGKNLSELTKMISSKVMDQSPKIPIKNGHFTCGNHRWFGHWGFEGAIPFNKPPLKNCLNNLSPEEREKVKRAIRKEWIKRVKKIQKLAVSFTSLNPKQAKAIAGLIYNTHLLGDWAPTNKVLEPLQHPNRITLDITKNLHRLFGSNSRFVQEIERDLAKIRLLKNPSQVQLQEYTEKVLAVLKKHDIGKRIYEVYAKQLSQNGIVYKVAGQALKSVSKILPSIISASYTTMSARAKPSLLKTSLKAGTVVAIFSGFSHSWQVMQGEEKIGDAFQSFAKDSTMATSSVYIADGVIQKIGGGKYALTAIVKEGVAESTKRVGAMLNYGVATFIFDETMNVFHYASGALTSKQFFEETGKSLTKAITSGLAAYCTVALGAGPGGFIVMAVTVGSYTVVNQAFIYAEKLNKRNFLFINDIFGELPLEMQHRITPWERNGSATPWQSADAQTPWNRTNKVTPWDKETRGTPWD